MSDLPRRIKAAQELGGYDSVKALADAISLKGFGEKTILRVIYGKRVLRSHERDAIARACGVSSEFFTADLTKLAEQPPAESDVVRAVKEAVAAHDQHMERAFNDIMEALRNFRDDVRLTERLDTIEDAVLGVRGDEMALRDAARRITQASVDQLEAGESAAQAEARTRNAEDAKTESDRSRREGTQ